jgi:hypothetical protein
VKKDDEKKKKFITGDLSVRRKAILGEIEKDYFYSIG